MKTDGIMELSDVFNNLITDYVTLRESLDEIYNESQNIRVLSFNSSIEAARAGNIGNGFRVIANEIRNISETNDSANQLCKKVVDSIEGKMHNLIGIRTADMAFDIIDKIDRNLFERFCDVQAWATFGKIIDSLQEPSFETKRQAELIIENLQRIYEVYHDIILTDISGKIICAGVHKELEGRSAFDTDWFQETINIKNVTFSDMYFSKSMNANAVAYSCPVRNPAGTILGVISTRFNWDFIQNIIRDAKVSSVGEIYVINKKGLVLSSRSKDDILKKNLCDWEAFRKLSDGTKFGYYTNLTQNKLAVYGFAKTLGYNAYSGKEWSVVIKEQY